MEKTRTGNERLSILYDDSFSPVTQCKKWLYDFMKREKCLPTRAVFLSAAHHGYLRATLKRSKSQLSHLIAVEKADVPGGWMWRWTGDTQASD